MTEKNIPANISFFFKKIVSNIKSSEDVEKSTKRIEKSIQKKNKGKVHELWDLVLDLYAFIKSDKVQWKKKVLPVAALIYLVSPIDALPDLIPAFLIDDAAVIIYVFAQVKDIVNDFFVSRKEDIIEVETVKTRNVLKKMILSLIVAIVGVGCYIIVQLIIK
jgi:uncharacterized membrane protein YkvA (DUF1232 family)